MQAGSLVVGPNFQGGTITNLTLDTMTLVSDATVSGVLNWTGGTISGSLTIASTGVLNLGGSNPKALYNALTNAGTVNWAGSGNLIVRNTTCVGVYGLIENLAGALWDIQGDQQMYNDYNCGIQNPYFHNAGTLRKSAATGTTTISIPFANAGTVAALQGTLAFYGGFNPTGGELLFGLNSLNNFGKISIAGNATLDGTVGAAWLGGYGACHQRFFHCPQLRFVHRTIYQLGFAGGGALGDQLQRHVFHLDGRQHRQTRIYHRSGWRQNARRGLGACHRAGGAPHWRPGGDQWRAGDAFAGQRQRDTKRDADEEHGSHPGATFSD